MKIPTRRPGRVISRKRREEVVIELTMDEVFNALKLAGTIAVPSSVLESVRITMQPLHEDDEPDDLILYPNDTIKVETQFQVETSEV